MFLTSLTKYRETGLLILRVALGIVFICAYGWPHLAGGIGKWRELGHDMAGVHIHFAPVFWGFLMAFSESVGMALFIVGLLFRPACILLAATMAIEAVSSHPPRGTQAIELCIIFAAFILIGPGKYSADKS